jgi:hypothetical protein
MTTLNYITITELCTMCDVEHTYKAIEGCERCDAHGPSHESFTRGHQAHCTGNCCF